MKTKHINHFVFLQVFILAAFGVMADSLNQWTWRFPNPQGMQLTAVTYGGGQFVAVGAGGTIITSPDGYNWVNRGSGTFGYLHGVAYADGEFAAVGDGGTILVSSNGISWVQIPSVTSNTLLGIAGNTGWRANSLPQFLAVGDSGTAISCNNNTNWSAQSSGTSNSLYAVTFTINVTTLYSYPTFVMVGEGGTVVSYSFGSFHQTSQNRVGTSNNLYCVASAGNGVFAAAGDLTLNPFVYATTYNEILYLLKNQTQWKSEQWVIGTGGGSVPGLWYLSEFFILTGMAYGPNGFVGVGYTGYGLEYHPAVVMTSATGTNWTEMPPSTSEDPLYGVTYGNGLYVAVGDFGSIVVSTNATNWTEVVPDRRGAIIAMACNSNLCIASALQASYSWGFPDLSILISTNGVNWAVSKTRNQLPVISDLDCNGTQFVGVSGTSIYTTVDGYNWSSNGSFTNSFHGVKYANGQFFAVGDNGSIYSSVDGTNWNNHSVTATGSFNAIAYGNGRFVTAGSVAATSSDGVSWTLCPSNPPSTVTRMIYAKGLFFATAYTSNNHYLPGGQILTSSDGIAWQIQYAEPNSEAFSGIAYNGGNFLAISGWLGNIFSSTDGLGWKSTSTMPWGSGLSQYYWPMVFPGCFSTVCAYNGTFLAGGAEGMLLQSGNTWNPTTITQADSSAGNLTLSFNQQVDVPYHIQMSTNLSDWRSISSGIGTGQNTNFILEVSPECPAEFIRLVSP